MNQSYIQYIKSWTTEKVTAFRKTMKEKRGVNLLFFSPMCNVSLRRVTYSTISFFMSATPTQFLPAYCRLRQDSSFRHTEISQTCGLHNRFSGYEPKDRAIRDLCTFCTIMPSWVPDTTHVVGVFKLDGYL